MSGMKRGMQAATRPTGAGLWSGSWRMDSWGGLSIAASSEANH